MSLSPRQRLELARTFIGVAGFSRFLRSEIFAFLTRRVYWERFLISKLSGRGLANALQGHPDYRCEDLVSVILPVNNGRSKGVERLVASLKAQTHRNIEFIAVDSGSTDDTVNWLRSEGFHIIEIAPESFTHAKSRNTGASSARGKYLLFVVDDAVFNDPDWLRSALYLMEHFGVDSLSTRQTIDEAADAYARYLDSTVSHAQSDCLSVNLSKSGFLVRWMHRVLPLQTLGRAVTIDDTNHLARRESFERILFHAPTVEDIDFALRLIQQGGRILYTNLLSVRHYHRYNPDSLSKFAMRVHVDTQVIRRWQPYLIRFPSRESFLVAGLQTLALFLQAMEEIERTNHALSARTDGQLDDWQVDATYIDLLIETARHLDIHDFSALHFTNYPSFDEARRFLTDILCASPPSALYHDRAVSVYFMRAMRQEIISVQKALFRHPLQTILRSEIKNVLLFIWANRIMRHMARPDAFLTSVISFPCDQWSIKEWT